jgi:hypothetical protein
VASAVFYNREVYTSDVKAVQDLIKKIKREQINHKLSITGNPAEINELMKQKKYWDGKTWEV